MGRARVSHAARSASGKSPGLFSRRADHLRLFFLPGYSPDLNPDEFLNHDVKSNALGRRRPRDAAELVSSVRSYLWSPQRQPAIVQSYFHASRVN